MIEDAANARLDAQGITDPAQREAAISTAVQQQTDKLNQQTQGVPKEYKELKEQLATGMTKQGTKITSKQAENIKAQMDQIIATLPELRSTALRSGFPYPELLQPQDSGPGSIMHAHAMDEWKPGQGSRIFPDYATEGPGGAAPVNINAISQPAYTGMGPAEEAMQAENLARPLVGMSSNQSWQHPGGALAASAYPGYQPPAVDPAHLDALMKALGITNPAILAMLLGSGGGAMLSSRPHRPAIQPGGLIRDNAVRRTGDRSCDCERVS